MPTARPATSTAPTIADTRVANPSANSAGMIPPSTKPSVTLRP